MNRLLSFVTDYWLYIFRGGLKFYSWLGFLGLTSCFWSGSRPEP